MTVFVTVALPRQVNAVVVVTGELATGARTVNVGGAVEAAVFVAAVTAVIVPVTAPPLVDASRHVAAELCRQTRHGRCNDTSLHESSVSSGRSLH